MIQSKHITVICLFTLPLTLLSCGIFGPTGGSPSDPLERGLISHYPLNGNARNAAGGHDGELVGAMPTPDRFGIEGGAVFFDGVDDFIAVAESEDLNFDLREDSYSIAMWVKSDDIEGWARLVSKWDEKLPTPYPFSIQKVGEEGWGAIYDAEESTYVVIDGLWDGAWHHLVFSYDAETDQLAGHLDGVQVAKRTATPVRDTRNASPVFIGRGALHIENRYFKGSMDDLRFYERILTEGEVRALFEAEG